MSDIVITEFMDESAVDALRLKYSVHYAPSLADAQHEIGPLLANARALIVRNRTQVNAAMLESGPNLLAVGRLGVGLDNIDQPACAARKVQVIPATGANDAAVAEYVITSAMILLRGAYHGVDHMRAGQWPRNAMMGAELGGKRLGLIGFGAIARQTASRASALGMEIAAYDPLLPADHAAWAGVERCDLPDLLARCDVLSLHVPLLDSTRHLLNAAAFAQMKPGAIVINAARGGVLDEDALIAAMQSGHMGGAALDVFETEPLSAAAGARFEGISNLILTPHIAGVTVESNQRVSALIATRIAEVLG